MINPHSLAVAGSAGASLPTRSYADWVAPAETGFGGTSHNPLMIAARPLLNLIVQIRNSSDAISPVVLRELLIEAIDRFQEQAQAISTPVETIIGARYCLCTVLDESAALTPWGGDGIWSAHSLLVTFHNETWGGEKFFQLLARLVQDPRSHWPLIELQFYCLVLGFEGRYRIIENGHAQLQALKSRIRKLLLSGGKGGPEALAAHWLDLDARNTATLRPWLPPWSWLPIAVLLAAGLYIGLLLALNGRLDVSYAAVNSIHLPELDVVGAPPTVQAPDLAHLLEADVQSGAIHVADSADRSLITIRGDGLFDSGKADIRPDYLAVLQRIAAALAKTPGRVSVAGYTDNQPIHTASFPSNMALATARASHVRDVLRQQAPGPIEQIEVAGFGEDRPVADNATAQGRALNRRVEIGFVPDPNPVSAP